MAKPFYGLKRLVEVAGASVLTMSVTLGPCFLTASEISNRLSSEEQAEIIADALDCDLSYMKLNNTGGIVRMVHNETDPIYVSINENVQTEEKEIIIDSLDYVFGLVGQINDHYKYEIIDQAELNAQKLLGKTTIEYEEGAILNNTAASINKKEHSLEKFSTNDYYSTFKISYDSDLFEHLSYDEKLYAFIHELLHAFGLDDVYTYGELKTTDVNHKNTMMKGYNISGSVLTPNDLKCLLSVYAEQYTNQEREEYILKAKQIVDIYQEYYYKNRVAKIKDNEKSELIDLTDKNVHSQFLASRTTLNSSVRSQKIEVEINDDQYIVKFIGGGRENISVSTGKVLEIDGVKVLNDVRFSGSFEQGLRKVGEETIMDLYVIRLDSHDVIYDASNLISYWGESLEEELLK